MKIKQHYKAKRLIDYIKVYDPNRMIQRELDRKHNNTYQR